MRVCQTLGHRSGLPTPFYYCRIQSGIHVRRVRGENVGGWNISHQQWEQLLHILANARLKTFSIAQTEHEEAHPQSLYDIIAIALRDVAGLDDSLTAYVCAILVHEGTLQLHHGKTVGPDARLVLRKSDPTASLEEFE